MKEEKKSESRASETHAVPTINFLSPEFNRVDDLSDCLGNYRTFETLDNVVTAHESHQLELEGDRSRNEAGNGKVEAQSNVPPARHAITDLPGKEGQPRKSEYISFAKGTCFHGRSRRIECTRCLDLCPTRAIRSDGGAISIERHLCNGCGACTLVCPADALELSRPSQEELLDSLRANLEAQAADTSGSVQVVISDSKQPSEDVSAESRDAPLLRVVHFPVQHIAHASLALILTALVHGAEGVTIACGPGNPPNVIHAVRMQVQMVRAILRGLGLGEENCRLVPARLTEIKELNSARTEPGIMSGSMAPAHLPAHDARRLVRAATRYLYDHSGAGEQALPLPVDSPFGTVAVNRTACTLCMACVTACPSGALSAVSDGPRLSFRESQCHQCGLCARRCPEGAIRLVPRLLCSSEVETQKALHESEPLRCIECGVPFASRTMMERITHKLSGHWMYSNEGQLRRLQMCRTCSARDAIASAR